MRVAPHRQLINRQRLGASRAEKAGQGPSSEITRRQFATRAATKRAAAFARDPDGA